MTQARNPFTRSGALRLNHPLFRGRASELARLEQACLSDLDFFLLVYGGRQNGKTTVLLRLEDQLKARRDDGVRVCRVDFQGLPRATSPDAYRHLARSVARVLPQAPPPPDAPDAPALGDFLEDALGGDGVQRLVLLLDELGTLPDATREDLAHVLRALHTRRLGSPALAKAQFVLAGGIELYRLAVVEASALRNVCEIVRLGDLDKADAVAVIADGLTLVGVEPAGAQALGQAVYARVSGHPYFTQRLGELLAARHLAGNEPDEATIEELAWALLEQDDPLLEHLRRSIAELRLEEAARRLLSASQRTSRTDDGTERLDLLGLARRTGRHWASRSPLLGVALAEWLGLPMPAGASMPEAAEAVRSRALDQHLHELQLEQRAVTGGIERAGSPVEQVRQQRRVSELANEFARVEAMWSLASEEPASRLDVSVVESTRVDDDSNLVPFSLEALGLSPDEIAALEAASDTLDIGSNLAPFSLEALGLSPDEIAVLEAASAEHKAPKKPEIQSFRQTATSLRSRISTCHLSLITPALVHIPAGPFLMGSADSDTLADSDEKPQHRLELPDYWIGKTPVTNAQFRPFVEGDGYRNQAYWTESGWQWHEQEGIVRPEHWKNATWNGADYPVVNVSWFEAVAYVRWLSAQTGHEFRLPSEAQWEKAARGPDGRIWPWGNTWEDGRCNSKEAGLKKTSPVGQYPGGASPYAALDMAGNVWEWCATQHGKGYPYQLENEWAEAYLEGDTGRRIRGGAYWSDQKSVRGAYRYYFVYPRNRLIEVGLRVASHSALPGSDS